MTLEEVSSPSSSKCFELGCREIGAETIRTSRLGEILFATADAIAALYQRFENPRIFSIQGHYAEDAALTKPSAERGAFAGILSESKRS